MYKFASYLYRTLLVLFSLSLVFWPVPMFMLQGDASERYVDFLFGTTGSTDRSRFAALPFVWMFMSLPLGLVLTPIGLVLQEIVEFVYNYFKERMRKK